MYTRYHRQQLCLHSSNLTFAVQQRVDMLALQNAKGRRMPTAFVFQNPRLRTWPPPSRLIDRAGAVGFDDLAIAEAEHLAEDIVGVFTE
jgi:hypothetical protein